MARRRTGAEREVLLGSVPDLYTTGDNDPEIEPQQYYRHYLYCDACGAFELEPWVKPDHHERLEQLRQRLGKAAALFAFSLVVVPGWLALGLVFSPAVLVLVVAGVSLLLVFWGLGRKFLSGSHEPLATRWRFFKAVLLWLVVVAAAQWLATDFSLPPWVLPIVGIVLVGGSLAWRVALGAKIEVAGLRCRRCRATYAYGTPFFTDLDANPRELTVDVVPRPLGSSPFERGRAADHGPSVP